ncbi:hypothetical protein NDN08_003995 [Rhodosorus marinus]|uniref:MIF4G domain-containing protein n=1 Tax=Rhodosorus marinus TaxID=101924 RepID=A0AAV8UH20_9RHOD|nr:hypothetical protein NDN08_003995 [Rhodosorus marinus]
MAETEVANGSEDVLEDVRFDDDPSARKSYPLQWLIRVREKVTEEHELTEEGSQSIKQATGDRNQPVSGGASMMRGSGQRGVRSPQVFSSGNGDTGFRRVDSGRQGGGVEFQLSRGSRTTQIRLPLNSSEVQRGSMYEPPAEQVPIERGENAWKPSTEVDKVDDREKNIKEIRSLLNKITLDTFDKLYSKLFSMDFSDELLLKALIEEVYEKALFQKAYVIMYADLCYRFNKDYQDKKKEEHKGVPEQKMFRKQLLQQCKKEFDTIASKRGIDLDPEELKNMDEDDRTAAEMKAKRRMLGNISFIGELYKKGLIPERILVEQCIRRLLDKIEKDKDEDLIECICHLFTTTGAHLVQVWTKHGTAEKIDPYFEKITELSSDKTLAPRIRFMLKDLLDLRNAGWKQARAQPAQQLKKRAEVQQEVRDEEDTRVQKQASSYGRNDHRNSGRRQGSVQPHVMNNMTSHLQPQRSASYLQGNQRKMQVPTRADSVSRNNLQDVRLGPSTGKKPWGSQASSGAANQSEMRRSMTTQKGGREDSNGPDSPRRLNTLPSRGLSGSINAPKPKEEKKVKAEALLEKEALVAKARNVMQEYAMYKNANESRQYMSEFPRAQRADVIKIWVEDALEAGTEPGVMSDLLIAVTSGESPPMSAPDFTKGVNSVVEVLGDLEIDYPMTGKRVPKYLAPVFASGNVEVKSLDALGAALSDAGPLLQMNFVVNLIAEYNEAKGEDEAKTMYLTTKMDLMSIAKSWDEKEGPEKLRSLLDEKKLTPLLA